MLEKLKAEAGESEAEQSRQQRCVVEIERRIANYERYLGSADPDQEETYWRLIREARTELKIVMERPRPKRATALDIEKVIAFLGRLEENWQNYPSRLRNRLLSLLVDRVELRHDVAHVDATIVWKTGFRQGVTITRPSAHFTKEKRWQGQEDDLMRMLWPSASWDALIAAFPGSTPAAINQRASRLRLTRRYQRKYPVIGRPWTDEDKEQLRELYGKGVRVEEIADKLDRTGQSVKGMVSMLRIRRPADCPRRLRPEWKTRNIKVMQETASL